MMKLTVAFESGHIEATKSMGLDSRWEFEFYTDTEGSYTACVVSEATLRALIAFVEAMDEVAP